MQLRYGMKVVIKREGKRVCYGKIISNCSGDYVTVTVLLEDSRILTLDKSEIQPQAFPGQLV